MSIPVDGSRHDREVRHEPLMGATLAAGGRPGRDLPGRSRERRGDAPAARAAEAARLVERHAVVPHGFLHR